jgi:hypothetical protein
VSAYAQSAGFAALVLALGCGPPAPRNSNQSLEMQDSTSAQESQPISSPALQTATPGKGLAVEVTVNSVALRGDTVGITYSLYNRPQSRDSLSVFAVDAPAGVTNIPRPQPKTEWWVSPTYKGRDIAFWAKLGTLPPATTSIPLYFESVGLPAVVTDWVVGDFPLPEGEGDDTTTDDELRDNAVIGKTIGVERFPPDPTPRSLLTRLRSLTQASCASPLLWITDSEICSQLLKAVDRAAANHSGGRTAQAKRELDHYRSLLSSPRQGVPADRVSSAAYWLLRSNAAIIENIL